MVWAPTICQSHTLWVYWIFAQLLYVQVRAVYVDVMLYQPTGEQSTYEQYAKIFQKQLQFAYGIARDSLKRNAERQIL